MVAAPARLIPPSLRVDALVVDEDTGITIRAVSDAPDVRCPVCGEPAERVHTRPESVTSILTGRTGVASARRRPAAATIAAA